MAELTLAAQLKINGELSSPAENCRLGLIPICTTEFSNGVVPRGCLKPETILKPDFLVLGIKGKPFSPNDPDHLSFLRRYECYRHSCPNSLEVRWPWGNNAYIPFS